MPFIRPCTTCETGEDTCDASNQYISNCTTNYQLYTWCRSGNHHYRGSSREIYTKCPINNASDSNSTTCNACNMACQFGNACGSYCNTCNSCQRYNTNPTTVCNSCNTNCNLCNICQSCMFGNQPVYDDYTVSQECGDTFVWDINPMSSTSVMGPNTGQFNKSVWNKLITYYNSKVSSTKQISSYNPSAGTAFTAAEFRRVADAVGYNYSTSDIASGKIIKGSYFRDLATAVNGMNTGTCRLYNTCSTCNGNCNSCYACNTCQSCNDGCQSCQRINSDSAIAALESPAHNMCDFCDDICEHCNSIIIDHCGYYCNRTVVTTRNGCPCRGGQGI